MAENKQKEAVKAIGADEEFERSVDELANILIKEEEGRYESELEPFEVHAQRMHKEIHEKMEDFRGRFLQGYELLLNDLAQQNAGTANTEGQVPPDAIKL